MRRVALAVGVGIATGAAAVAYVHHQDAIVAPANTPAHVYLYQFHAPLNMSGTMSLSGPCAKVETFLRLAKVPHTVVAIDDTTASPSGRLPCVALNGDIVCESEAVLERLRSAFPGSLADVTGADAVTAHMLRRLAEDSLYFLTARHNVVDHFDTILHHADLPRVASFVPFPVLRVAADFLIRQRTVTRLNQQGVGDLSHERYHEEMTRDFKAIESVLGSKQYMLGDAPTTADCYVFPYLQMAIHFPDTCEAYEYVRRSETLRAYAARMESRLGQ